MINNPVGASSAPKDNRIDKFLNSYKFYPNSIQFRIISSKGLEKFKNVQSFQLNQLINGKFEFSLKTREVLLLKYDMWSRWLYEIENLFIEFSGAGEEAVYDEVLDTIIALAEKTESSYSHIIFNRHHENFDRRFSNIWNDAHKEAFRLMLEHIKMVYGKPYGIAFKDIVDILCSTLQYTITELLEINTLLSIFGEREQKLNVSYKHACDVDEEKDPDINGDIPFIIIGPFAEECLQIDGFCLTSNRINVYKKYFDIDKIYIKNYLDKPIPMKVLDNIEKSAHVNIDYKRSLLT